MSQPNIFDLLNVINTKDYGHYDKLTQEDRKKFVPFVLMKWMTGTSNDAQILLLNEFVNRYVFSLYQHPNLLNKLLMSCAPGTPKRYNWRKTNTDKVSRKPLTVTLLEQVYNYSKSEAESSLTLLKGTDIIAIAEVLGWQETDIIKLGKEWDMSIKASKGSKAAKQSKLNVDDSPNTTQDLLEF